MKPPRPTGHLGNAFTLLEMSIVIMVLLSLISLGLYSTKKLGDWQRGREASETLRSVYSAQRLFLADNPTTAVASLTEAMLIDYVPNARQSTPKPTTLMTALRPAENPLKSLTGETLGFLITQSPPRFKDSSGSIYDPSGASNAPATFRDSLWDVGE